MVVVTEGGEVTEKKGSLRALVPSIFIPSGVYQVGAGALVAVLALGAINIG